MTPTLPTLELQYWRDRDVLLPVAQQFAEMYRFYQVIKEYSPLLDEWFLASSTTIEDALRYRAFDANGPTAAALAVIKQENRNVHDIRSISLWNGAMNEESGATLSSRCNVIGRPDALRFGLKLHPEVLQWQVAVHWMQAALAIWPALFATFAPLWYPEKRVFKDRPGVGWMLYLPHVLTARQVPEARMLIPVMDSEKRQTGTIIVSVVDEPFSLDNPAHIKAANEIEVRLVDQDLLPSYRDI